MTNRNGAIRWTAAVAVVAMAGLVPAAQAERASVKADDFSFSPKTVKIKRHDKVRWANVEGTHTVTMDEGGQDLDAILSGSGKVTSKKFKKKGRFDYVCTFHLDEGMTGKVLVK